MDEAWGHYAWLSKGYIIYVIMAAEIIIIEKGYVCMCVCIYFEKNRPLDEAEEVKNLQKFERRTNLEKGKIYCFKFKDVD